MHSNQTIPQTATRRPPYATLRVLCDGREYIPTHVSDDRLIFAQPPHLPSSTVQIGVTINGHERRWTATLQPHSPEDAEIGIRLA